MVKRPSPTCQQFALEMNNNHDVSAASTPQKNSTLGHRFIFAWIPTHPPPRWRSPSQMQQPWGLFLKAYSMVSSNSCAE
ncbi:hypothetical protein BD779DRAFT_1519175 [Infundibulicybe gibba]|nr:hypothetical protein BD779DRAFT_1519175 [Infundibulicybe gibba]